MGILLLVFLLAAADTSPRNSGADYYPLREGLSWVYQDGTQEVTITITGTEKIDGKLCYIMEEQRGIGSKSRKWVTKAREGVRVLRYDYVGTLLDFDTPVYRFKYPHGRKHTWKWKGTIAGSAWEFEGKQLGFETLKVGERSYRCLKTRVDYKYSGREYYRTQWYAPGVGLVKVAKTSPGTDVITTTELKEFKPAKKK